MKLSFEDGASIAFNNKDEFVKFIKDSADVAGSDYSMDVVWLILCAGLVFLMQVRLGGKICGPRVGYRDTDRTYYLKRSSFENAPTLFLTTNSI